MFQDSRLKPDESPTRPKSPFIAKGSLGNERAKNRVAYGARLQDHQGATAMAQDVPTITPRKTAVGYLRVSTDEQVDSGLSLENQEARIRAYCAAVGLELVALVHDAGVSGGKSLEIRQGGARLLSLLTAGAAWHVVSLKLDRLFRDTVDALGTARTWDDSGIGLHLVDHGGQSINTSSAVGRMFLTMLAGFAEFERGLVRERTSAAMSAKRARGEIISRPTIGFDRDGSRLVPNAGEQALIGRMAGLRAEGQSFGLIAATLNAEGVPTKRGGRWQPSTVMRVLGRVGQ